MGLQSEGFRFMHRSDGTFTWVHPSDIRADDYDCTDMTDAQFHGYVVQVTGEPPKCPNTGDLFEGDDDEHHHAEPRCAGQTSRA